MKDNLKKLPLFLILVLILNFLLINGRDVSNKMRFDDTLGYTNVTNNIETSGIKKTDSNFQILEDVGDLKINSKDEIKSLELQFNNIPEGSKAKVYYSRNKDNYTKNYSLEVYIKDNYCVISIPIENVNSIMISFVNDFDLKAIHTSNYPVILEKDEISGIKSEFFVINAVIALGLTYLIYKINLKEKITILVKKISNRKKTVFMLGISTAVIFILMIGVQIICKYDLITKINNDYFLNIPRIIFTVAASVILSLIIVLWKKISTNLESIFICSSLFVGIIFAIYLPVFQEGTWDVSIHYSNANQLSTICYESYSEINDKVGTLETSYSVLERKDISDKYDMLHETSELSKTKDIPISSVYTFIGYIPMSIGIFIAKGLGLTLSNTIIFGRIMSSIFYSLISYFALKKLDKGKIVLFIIALYPTIVLLSGSYSYDTWIISLFFLGLSYLFSVMQSETKINNKDMIIILASLFLACGPKAIYFPVFLLCFLIPQDRFVSSKQRNNFYLSTILLSIITVSTFILPMLISNSSGKAIGDFRGGSGINGAEQIKYILTHPIVYIKNIFNYLKDYYLTYKTIWLCSGEIGYLGMSKFYYLNAITMVLNLIVGDRYILSGKRIYIKKILGVIIVLATIVLIVTTFYIMYTPVGAVGVGGCQIRYLLPIIFPLMFMLYNNKVFIKINKKYIINLTVIVSIFVLYSTLYYNLIGVYNF